MHTSKLRPPSSIELTFYDELLAPLLLFASSGSDALWTRQSRQLAQRFRKDITRYGYLLTKSGVMVVVEPDILDTELDICRRNIVAADMQILDRLTSRTR
jgi:hypothetical protein